MINKYRILALKNSIILWRLLGLSLLCLLWLNGHDNEIGVVLLLFLSMMELIRWRFELPIWTLLIDQVACIVVIPYWPYASFGFVIPIFESMLLGQPLFVLPSLLFSIFSLGAPVPLIAALIQAGLSGWTLASWVVESDCYRQEADRQRRDRYELEELKRELLRANVQATRMAEISERNRIAQELHDDVGHELTGAVLALQAFEQLWNEDDISAQDMFSQVKHRLFNSATRLRETAHNIKPIKPIGVNRIQEICNEFNTYPIELGIYGDTSIVPVYMWSIIEPSLKEALTNVVRHSKATKVIVSLDINPNLVRLSVHDNGVGNKETSQGIGIRNLRQRAQAIGGSITTGSSKDGFRLVCVLPLDSQ